MNDGAESLSQVLLEDTQFGEWIQKSVSSWGFRGVPLSYQEARIYHWHQFADRLIGTDRIPPELRVAQVIGGVDPSQRPAPAFAEIARDRE